MNQEANARRADVVRRKILAAGAAVADDPNLSFTFDAVAEMAGVGRRTVFRYFPTRDALLAATVNAVVDDYVDSVPHRGDEELGAWLRQVVAILVAENDRRSKSYFDLVLGDHGPLTLAALERRANARRRLSETLAAQAWTAAGRRGHPPPWIVHTYTLHLGPFATKALVADAGLTAEGAVDVIATTLETVTRAAK